MHWVVTDRKNIYCILQSRTIEDDASFVHDVTGNTGLFLFGLTQRGHSWWCAPYLSEIRSQEMFKVVRSVFPKHHRCNDSLSIEVL
jgi:hypothetical protein